MNKNRKVEIAADVALSILTRRQCQVVAVYVCLKFEGHSYTTMATRMGIKAGTFVAHLRQACERLGVPHRRLLVLFGELVLAPCLLEILTKMNVS